MRVRMNCDLDLQLRMNTKNARWSWNIRSGEYFRLSGDLRPRIMRRYGWSFWKGRRSGVVIAPGIDISCSVYRWFPAQNPSVSIDVETLGGK